jgi:hypothetical protein
MNAREIYNRALTVVGLPDDDGMVGTDVPSVPVSLVRSAIEDLALMEDWYWAYTETTIPLVAGQTEYTIDTDLMAVSFISVADVPLMHQQRRDLIQWGTITGRPRYYAIQGTKLHVFPVPNGTDTELLVGSYGTEAEVTSLDDIPAVPYQFQGILVQLTAKAIAQRVSDQSSYTMAVAEAKRQSDFLVRRQNRTKATQKVSVRRGGGF